MKFEFQENKHYSYINLVPETPEETAQLLRFTKSSKKETPYISFSFNNETPRCYIQVKKVADVKQNNFIRNK